MSAAHEPWTPVLSHRLIRPWLRTPIKVNGVEFVLPYVGGDTPVAADYDDEPWMGRLLAKLHELAPGAIVDVGTNVGQTLRMAKSIDRDWPYIGFEPNPTCCFVVKELIRANRLPACQLVPLGLGARPEVLRFFSSEATDASASVVEGFREESHYKLRGLKLVGVCQGDATLALMGDFAARVGVVKVDVEGGELEALQGLRGTLARDRPFCVCEVLPVYDAATENGQFRLGRQQAIEALLRDLDYRIVRVHRDGRMEPLDGFGVHGDMALSNYLFAPSEQCSECLQPV